MKSLGFAAISLLGLVMTQLNYQPDNALPDFNKPEAELIATAPNVDIEDLLYRNSETLESIKKDVDNLSGSFVGRKEFAEKLVAFEGSVGEIKDKLGSDFQDSRVDDLIRRVEELEKKCATPVSTSSGGSSGSVVRSSFTNPSPGYSVSSGGSSGSLSSRSYAPQGGYVVSSSSQGYVVSSGGSNGSQDVYSTYSAPFYSSQVVTVPTTERVRVVEPRAVEPRRVSYQEVPSTSTCVIGPDGKMDCSGSGNVAFPRLNRRR